MGSEMCIRDSPRPAWCPPARPAAALHGRRRERALRRVRDDREDRGVVVATTCVEMNASMGVGRLKFDFHRRRPAVGDDLYVRLHELDDEHGRAVGGVDGVLEGVSFAPHDIGATPTKACFLAAPARGRGAARSRAPWRSARRPP